MNEIPKVSIFASAIRTRYWADFYRQIAETNKTPFEIIFAGPKAPEFQLPGNFVHIPTDVKPAQCAAIAASACRGELLVQAVDDVEYSPGAIDEMYEAYQQDPNAMVTCRYYFGSQDCSSGQNALGRPHEKLSLLPVCGMISRADFLAVGGIDRRFYAIMWEIDLYLRISIQLKRKTIFVNGTCREFAQEKIEGELPRLSQFFMGLDRASLLQIWNLDDYLSEEATELLRRYPTELYQPENILFESQAVPSDDVTFYSGPNEQK